MIKSREFVPGKMHQIDSTDMVEEMLHYTKRTFSAAEVIASNATALPLVDDPLDGYALIFLEATVNIHGGSANYDQNQDFTVAYKTDGSGTTVSTTLANFMNAGAAGAIKTIKQITTDVVVSASEGLALLSSASPKNAAGDRQLTVITRYYVVPVST